MKKAFEVNKILVPLDFSPTSHIALEHAALFCSKFNASLHLLHVYKGRDIDILPDVTTPRTDQDELKKRIGNELNSIASKFNVASTVEVREGSVAKEITLAAREAEASMIIMGTHGTSGIEEFFMGSNAYRVVNSSELPVLTVQKPVNDGVYKKIFIGIDSSTHTRDKVSHVAAIAKAFGSKVHVSALVTETHEEEGKIFNIKIKQIMEYLEHQGVEFEHDEVHGDDIAEMVMDKAKDVNADLISIMTEQEARTGLFVGEYAQRIVNHSKIPVLSVTPFEIVDHFSQSDLGGDYRPFYI